MPKSLYSEATYHPAWKQLIQLSMDQNLGPDELQKLFKPIPKITEGPVSESVFEQSSGEDDKSRATAKTAVAPSDAGKLSAEEANSKGKTVNTQITTTISDLDDNQVNAGSIEDLAQKNALSDEVDLLPQKEIKNLIVTDTPQAKDRPNATPLPLKVKSAEMTIDRNDRGRKSRHKKRSRVDLPRKTTNRSIPVILASTNSAFLDFTDNWLESLKRCGISSGITLVAEDHSAYYYLNNRTDIDLDVLLTDEAESPSEKLLFDSPEYKRLVNKRPSYVLRLLENGHDVLFSDVDIVWLKNPLPYFDDKHDVWLQEDQHDPPVYCAGFTLYRSTPWGIKLVKEWVKELGRHPTLPDQRVLNNLLKKDRYQQGLKRAVMDPTLFPNGNLFFDPKWRAANSGVETVMVHNNWIIGHDLKVERFKQEGLWYLDEEYAKQRTKR
ncbi:uncharacterized protein [Diadema antillarum]|uniref:uncharacterized protein n=1 Tax=Diadema antillarum TaxID=105358 RepID=UPI003A88B4BA